MARARNPRVIAMEILAGLKRDANEVRSRLVRLSHRTVFESSTETRMVPKHYGQPVSETNPLVARDFMNSTTRDRRPEEYPEAHSSEWANLWCHADAMAQQAEALKALALAEWQKFPENQGYIMTRKES